MKKTLLILMSVMMILSAYAQNPTSEKSSVKSSVKSFKYPDYLYAPSLNGPVSHSGNTLEISYSKKLRSYVIEFIFRHVRYGLPCYMGYELHLTYEGMNNNSYYYSGYDVYSGMRTVVKTFVRLERFLNNYGQIEDEWLEPDKSIEINMKFGSSVFIYPIKDTPERRKKEKEERLKEAEAEQKELEKARRLAAERRAKIDDFLISREKEVFNISSLDTIEYANVKDKLSETIISAVDSVDIDNLTVVVRDVVSIDYMGKTGHHIDITGVASVPQLENRIKSELEQVRFSPMRRQIQGTDTICTVNSNDEFNLRFSLSTQRGELKIRKSGRNCVLKSGDGDFYQQNKSNIDDALSKGKGIYKIMVTNRNINDIANINVDIKKFRSVAPKFMLGYNYTPFASAGFTLGISNICCSNFGAFIKYGKKSAISPQNDEAKITEYTDRYVGYSYFTLGTTYSISKYGFLYAGIGYGSKTDENRKRESYTTALKTGGVNLDAGVIVRPIKWAGVSVGYNYIAGKDSFGGVNLGLLLFL